MPLTPPQLDNRTFEELLTEVRRRIPTFTPEWTDLNESDPGIVLAQLFAFMSEQLLFQIDQVPNKGLVTFLKLVGEDLHAATPAVADVTFIPIGQNPGYLILPEGSSVATAAPAAGEKQPVIFETLEALPILNATLAELGSLDCNGVATVHTAANDASGASYRPFGDANTIRDTFFLGFKLPAGATQWPEGTFRVRVNLAGSTEVGDPPDQPPAPELPPRIEWNYAIKNTNDAAGKGVAFSKSITPTKDSTRELTRSGYLEFDFSTEDAAKFIQAAGDTDIEFMRGLFLIRARILRPDAYEAPPELDTVRLNTVPASAVQTVLVEKLGGSTGLPFQRFRLANAPVVPGSVEISVAGVTGTWKEVDDIFDVDATDLVFELLPATGEVLFGDGKHGRIPPPDDGSVTGGNITADRYQFGGGIASNVGSKTLTQVQFETVIGSLDATNVLPARGGDDEETVAEGVARAPAVVRSRYRAVSAADFEALAKETPSVRVARARAVANTKPGRLPGTSPGCVTVVLVPHVLFEASADAPIPVPDFVARAVLEYLDARRLVTTSLFTSSAVFRKVTVDATVLATPRAIPTLVQSEVNLALQRYFHALVGGEDGDGWPFGGTVFFSRVFEQILDLPSVVRVDRLAISLDDGPFVECTDVPICAGELLYSGAHSIVVKSG